MPLSEEEIRTIGSETGKKMVVSAKCKERAEFILDEIESATEHENFAIATITDLKRAKNDMLTGVHAQVQNLNEFYPDMPLKSMVLTELSKIKVIVEQTDKKNPEPTIHKVAEAYDNLHNKLLDMLLEDFTRCQCGEGTKAVIKAYDPEIERKVKELGGIRYRPVFREAIFKKDDRMAAEQFATWIVQHGAYNIAYNPYDVPEPGLSVLFDL
jgi:hypothetical protein